MVTGLLSLKIVFKLTPFLNYKSNIFLANKESNILLSFKEKDMTTVNLDNGNGMQVPYTLNITGRKHWSK